MTTHKPTNPKDIVGSSKTPLSVVPTRVTMEVGLAMLEGALKYGRHNYREAGVRASVYYDALMRHMNTWWEGEDIDAKSGLNHITKAISTLYVLRDSMMHGNLEDDRPPKAAPFMEDMDKHAADLMARLGGQDVTHYTERDHGGYNNIRPEAAAHFLENIDSSRIRESVDVMADAANWQVGDLVTCVDPGENDLTQGKQYMLRGLRGQLGIELNNDDGIRGTYKTTRFVRHSRPENNQ